MEISTLPHIIHQYKEKTKTVTVCFISFLSIYLFVFFQSCTYCAFYSTFLFFAINKMKFCHLSFECRRHSIVFIYVNTHRNVYIVYKIACSQCFLQLFSLWRKKSFLLIVWVNKYWVTTMTTAPTTFPLNNDECERAYFCSICFSDKQINEPIKTTAKILLKILFSVF